MIKVPMGQQHPSQPSEPKATAQDLTLRPLSTVNEEPLIAVEHHLRRQATLDRRCRRGSSQKDQFEHKPYPL